MQFELVCPWTNPPGQNRSAEKCRSCGNVWIQLNESHMWTRPIRPSKRACQQQQRKWLRMFILLKVPVHSYRAANVIPHFLLAAAVWKQILKASILNPKKTQSLVRLPVQTKKMVKKKSFFFRAEQCPQKSSCHPIRLKSQVNQIMKRTDSSYFPLLNNSYFQTYNFEAKFTLARHLQCGVKDDFEGGFCSTM